MKKSTSKLLSAGVVVAFLGATVFGLPLLNRAVRPLANSAVTGDYVEARTASVFCGACHYNGELMCTGRDAIMAWNFTGGSHNGVSLAGVRVAADITSQENLSDTTVVHKTEIVVDSGATSQQVDAVVSLLKSTCAENFGTVSLVRRAPISFAHTTDGYAVNAAGFAELSVKYMPDDACCVQPGLVWYSPLSPVQNRKVGYTELASFSGEVSPPWYRTGENGAFYGLFTY